MKWMHTKNVKQETTRLDIYLVLFGVTAIVVLSHFMHWSSRTVAEDAEVFGTDASGSLMAPTAADRNPPDWR